MTRMRYSRWLILVLVLLTTLSGVTALLAEPQQDSTVWLPVMARNYPVAIPAIEYGLDFISARRMRRPTRLVMGEGWRPALI